MESDIEKEVQYDDNITTDLSPEKSKSTLVFDGDAGNNKTNNDADLITQDALKRTHYFPDNIDFIARQVPYVRSNSDPKSSRPTSPMNINNVDDDNIPSGSNFSDIAPFTDNNGIKTAIPHSKTENDLQSVANSNDKFKKLSSLASITQWWKSYVDDKINSCKKLEQTEEIRMRHKLKYHFMSPFQKYKLGRRPWKLAIQILKIFIVTTQVFLFGADRFASVAFVKHTQKTFQHLFIENYDGSKSFSYYSRIDLVNAIKYVDQQYHDVTNVAVGRYWYDGFTIDNPKPVKYCEERYINSDKNSTSGSIDYGAKTETVCEGLVNYKKLTHILKEKHYFDRIVSIEMKFKLYVIYLNGIKLRHKTECLSMKNTIHIDNSNHDGRLRVSFVMDQAILKTCPTTYKISQGAEAIRDVLIGFDVLVVFICFLSCMLCIRSLVKSIILAQAAQKYFQVYKNEVLTRWDSFQLINKWFAVIVISDLLSIVGSIYKIRVDERDIQYYNICSVLLGLGVVLVWIGLLRFFTYLKKYNILLITLSSAAPSLLRFMFCAMFMFFGFTFCGWIVLGPYHAKFATFLSTAECLFSLLNGDDMYPTFAHMSKRSTAIWVFSKIYLYTFVSLFIYVVLSTFISIVGNSYERLKDWGRMPPTRIERFMDGKKVSTRKSNKNSVCERCIRESQVPTEYADADKPSSSYGTMDRFRSSSLSSSQLSIVSCSLE